MDEPPKLTPPTPVITTFPDGDPALSTEVATEKSVLGYDLATAGLVIPEIDNDWELPKVQPDPVRSIVTVSPLVFPFVGGFVHVNPDPSDTTGEDGITKPLAKVTEIVSASVRAVDGVNETVQVVFVAPA